MVEYNAFDGYAAVLQGQIKEWFWKYTYIEFSSFCTSDQPMVNLECTVR